MNYYALFLIIWIFAMSPFQNEKGNENLNGKNDSMKIEYHPIGVFHSPLTPETGAPRQGILEPENKGVIEIFDEYADCLRSLDEYDYIIVLYHLDKSTGWHANVTPPRSKRSYGLFATRSPNRPNPIGLGVIKLDRVEETNLHVSGIDAFEGTPVLDIKPWLPSIDCPVDPAHDKMEQELGID
jgi:tRNA-Thr(GGU) m(6)t(6)A37 methyltransferase TsaA